MNLYITPAELKAAIQMPNVTTPADARLEALIEEMCRYIDDELGRWFYELSDTRYYDGPGGVEWWLPDDVISITTLKWDEDDDGTFETTLTQNTDFRGWPYNGTHFRRLDVLPRRSSVLNSWPKQERALELVGTFGWAAETEATGDTVEDDPSVSAAATSLTVNDPGRFQLGQTLLVGTEQMYVSAVHGDNTLGVVRGVNGTTAAIHLKDVAISRYLYPRPLRTAIRAEVIRWYREESMGYAGNLLTNEGGDFRVVWPAIVSRLSVYRKASQWAGVGL